MTIFFYWVIASLNEITNKLLPVSEIWYLFIHVYQMFVQRSYVRLVNLWYILLVTLRLSIITMMTWLKTCILKHLHIYRTWRTLFSFVYLNFVLNLDNNLGCHFYVNVHLECLESQHVRYLVPASIPCIARNVFT